MLLGGARLNDSWVATVSRYSRPASLVEALELLEPPAAVVLGGGTKINATPSSPVEVVDLQALDLARIETAGSGTVLLGARVTLQELADAEALPHAIREAARREQPSTLRAQATLAGTVATGDPESELLAVLLVHEASVSVQSAAGVRVVSLADLLATLPLPRTRVITDVTVDVTGTTAVSRLGRTRADRPIVAAAARVTPGGTRLLALSGVAATPVLVDDVHELDPPSDFRGSREYRQALAEVLAARALEAVSG
jgi:putative selenate reductase FAD-binding subunit